MSIDTNKHYKRSKNCEYGNSSSLKSTGYYRNGPGRRLKAVASHSRYGLRNIKALSRHIDGEANMHHTDRKSFRLPCGFSLADSWAGLRKAWHGFKIANSNQDREKMRHYAKIIRKLQLEIGIRVTHFDEDILDAETIWQIERKVKEREKAVMQEVGNQTSGLPNDGAGEREYDYDAIMVESKKEIMPNNLPPPSEKTFMDHIDR